MVREVQVLAGFGESHTVVTAIVGAVVPLQENVSEYPSRIVHSLESTLTKLLSGRYLDSVILCLEHEVFPGESKDDAWQLRDGSTIQNVRL